MLRAMIAALAAIPLLLVGCGIDSRGLAPLGYEKVTGIELTPAQPSAGQLVEVRAQYASTRIYPQAGGVDRPNFQYSVNCGEIIAWPRMGTARIHGHKVSVRNDIVEWQLPDGHGIARLKVTLPDGSQSIAFQF